MITMAKLRRLSIPSFWKVPKKLYKWTVSPRPGPHPKFYSIPLQVIVRDVLKLAETGKEARTIIKRGELLVDGKVRKDHAYPAGLFDVISIPRLRQHYRVVPFAKGLQLIKISEKESNLKICKIENKSVVKKNRLQLNLNDGKNILTDEKYNIGDSLLLELPSLKIVQHIPLDKGSLGIVSKGANAGKVGEVKGIVPGKMKERPKVMCEIDGKTQEILKDRFFVIGKDKPLITLSE